MTDKELIQPEQKPWGWAILHNDGTEACIRPRVYDFFGGILENEPFTAEDLQKRDISRKGYAPHTMVTLYTQPFLCKDCKHYKHYDYCEHPANGVDLVSGRQLFKWAFVMRKDSSACGIEGKLWEPKKPWYKFWSST